MHYEDESLMGAAYNLIFLGLKMNTKILLVVFAIVAPGFGLSTVVPTI
jgi:hypothetical protein